jgi:hypothetical protein
MGLKPLFVMFVSTLLVSCSSSLFHKILNTPSWILSPEVDGGLAVTECEVWTGEYSENKKAAENKSHVKLVQTLNSNVAFMEKHYVASNTSQNNAASQNNLTFIQASSSLVPTYSAKAKTVKIDFADFKGREHICVMVHLDEPQLAMLFDEVIASSGRDIEKVNKQELYLRFKSAASTK